MENGAPAAPPGWYPGPDGAQRYWDGEKWLDNPAPPSAPATEPASASPSPKRGRIVAIVAGILVVLIAAGGGGWVVWSQYQANLEAEEAAAEASREAAAEEAAREAQEAADEAEREQRAETVTEIEDSVTTMAEEDADEGFIAGPVLRTACSPVNGGSTDDLTEITTVFECFVAVEDHDDGTSTGYYYNATMNWDTGSYTYGFGRP